MCVALNADAQGDYDTKHEETGAAGMCWAQCVADFPRMCKGKMQNVAHVSRPEAFKTNTAALIFRLLRRCA